jgi:DNA-binding PucR family transcriptional regulator
MTRIVVQDGMRSRTDLQRVSWVLSFAQSKLRGWQDADWLETFRDALEFAAAGRLPMRI